MNLSTLLSSRASMGRPVRAALIGAGKFGSMILSQIPRIEGLHMPVVVDLDVGQARQSFKRVGWADGQYDARSAGEAIKNGTTSSHRGDAGLPGRSSVSLRPPAHPLARRVTRSPASSTANTSS